MGKSKTNGQNKPKLKKSGLIVFLTIVVMAVGSIVFQFLTTETNIEIFSSAVHSPEISFSFSTLPPRSSKNYIAVLHIEGVIEDKNTTYDQSWLLDTIYELSNDEHNTGILLYIDSPGGGVYQSDEVYLELVNYKESSDKPVWAYLGPMAASGGYYIACAADYIIANRNTLTGSIGVIAGQSFDLSGLMEKHGIKMSSFTAGRNKNMLGINSPVTAEHQQIMQSIAEECYNQFTGIVAQSRNLSLQNVVELADGRIYTAQQALKNGLIDKISRFEEAVDAMLQTEDLNLSELVHYYPKAENSFYKYIMGATKILRRSLAGNQTFDSQLIDSLTSELRLDVPYPAFYYQH